jgi:hypothetical protein
VSLRGVSWILLSWEVPDRDRDRLDVWKILSDMTAAEGVSRLELSPNSAMTELGVGGGKGKERVGAEQEGDGGKSAFPRSVMGSGRLGKFLNGKSDD